MRAPSPRATRRDAHARPHASPHASAHSRHQHRDAGLTLVEMVVSVGIVMVVLTAALSVFVLAKKAQQTAEGTDQATQLAYEQIERIRQQDWIDIGFQPSVMPTIQGATAREATSTTDADYRGIAPMNDGAGGATIPSGETQVLFSTNTRGSADIKPYQTLTASNNKFRVYTSITYGALDFNGDGAHDTYDLPSTSSTTGLNQYTFKRVTITVHWQASGNGTAYKITAETWFAPEAEDAVPPGVPCIREEDGKECSLP